MDKYKKPVPCRRGLSLIPDMNLELKKTGHGLLPVQVIKVNITAQPERL